MCNGEDRQTLEAENFYILRHRSKDDRLQNSTNCNCPRSCMLQYLAMRIMTPRKHVHCVASVTICHRYSNAMISMTRICLVLFVAYRGACQQLSLSSSSCTSSRAHRRGEEEKMQENETRKHSVVELPDSVNLRYHILIQSTVRPSPRIQSVPTKRSIHLINNLPQCFNQPANLLFSIIMHHTNPDNAATILC